MATATESYASRFLPHPKTVAVRASVISSVPVLISLTIQIVGCPFRGGQSREGVDHGPIRLVQAGLPEQLAELGWTVNYDGHHQFEEIDEKNDPPIGKMKNPRLVSRVCEAVAKVVGDHAKHGQLPLTLGGDHSLAMGTISGTLRSATGLFTYGGYECAEQAMMKSRLVMPRSSSELDATRIAHAIVGRRSATMYGNMKDHVYIKPTLHKKLY
ncbi:hypothetical protein EVJ58_g8862 [Rhodofomes roseus]|uniref:Arginase n=1 Tax=Rhodofomes roseus TaxID=34475 RepID=A0A4Y9XW25_9APHY|nr:hypothetical protein EVJ58_g8862 [Rhodofomes roseus]